MQYRPLGNTGINVSKLGIGSGTSGFTGECIQHQMSHKDFSDLLLYGLDLGINYWDTALTYYTYPHIKYALQQVKREEVVIASKTNRRGYQDVMAEVEETLKALGTDYVDIFLLHGMRNSFDFKLRRGALKALIKAKEKGYVRALGFSSHGIGATETGMQMDEIDLIMSRLNYTGDYMDSYQENIISKLVSIPFVYKLATTLIPKSILPSVSKAVEPPKPTAALQQKTRYMLQTMHTAGKGIVCMKIFGAGALVDQPEKAIAFAKKQTYVSTFVIGMANKEEIKQNVSLFG